MKKIKWMMIPLVSIFVGCGTSSVDENRVVDLDSVNEVQESLIQNGVAQVSDISEVLPEVIKQNRVRENQEYSVDEGYPNGN